MRPTEALEHLLMKVSDNLRTIRGALLQGGRHPLCKLCACLLCQFIAFDTARPFRGLVVVAKSFCGSVLSIDLRIIQVWNVESAFAFLSRIASGNANMAAGTLSQFSWR